jgi:2-C-methyl-D-erythritol 4-phosphate cytidylyltransferase
LGADLEFVVVHDAVRPLVTIELLARVLDAAEQFGAAVPVLPVSSTLLVASAEGESAGPLARSSVREAQTPQAAKRDALDAALAAYPHETDESGALYRFGSQVTLVRGLRANIKITVPDDLLVAEALLACRRSA